MSALQFVEKNEETLMAKYNIDFPQRIVYLAAILLLYGLSTYLNLFLASKILSPTLFAEIRVGQSVFSILTVLIGVGIPTAVLVLSGRMNAKDPSRKDLLIKYALSAQLKLSVIFSFFILALFLFAHYYFLVSLKYFWVIFLLATFFSACIQAAQSYAATEAGLRSYILAMLLAVPIGIIITALSILHWGVKGYCYGYAFSQILIFIAYYGVIFSKHKTTALTHIEKLDKSDIKKFWHIGKYSLLSNSLSIFLANIDILLLSIVLTSKLKLGYYSFASLFFIVASFYNATFQQYILPRMSKKHAEGQGFHTLVLNYAKINVVLSFFGLLIGGGITYFIIHIFFTQYIPATLIVEILLLAWFIRSCYNPFTSAIISCGHVQYTFRISVILVVVNLFLITILTYFFDLYGAAVAQALAYFLAGLLSIYFYRKLNPS